MRGKRFGLISLAMFTLVFLNVVPIPFSKHQPLPTLTIYTCPKSFTGIVGFNQRLAIASWLMIEPRPEIILMCNDSGVDRVARDLGFVHNPNIPHSASGAPHVDAIMKSGEDLGTCHGDVTVMSW